MKLYHGSTVIIEHPEIMKGDRFLDFGYGFYTTTNLEQAIRWSRIKKQRTKSEKAIVNVYKVDDLILDSLSVLNFKEPDRKWLEFILNNRRGQVMHPYDLVKGAVADDTLYQTLTLYEAGALSVEETVARLKVHHLFDQLSFHTENALKELHFQEAFEI